MFSVKEKLNEDADSEIATTSLRVSLACPLGKMRMSTPCRASTCSHLQCFDASLFLLMNERKPTWNCPVCDKAALYDNLVIDGYFQEVLSSSKLLSEVNEIQLLQDGSWENLVPKKEKEKDKTDKIEMNVKHQKVNVDTVDLGKLSKASKALSLSLSLYTHRDAFFTFQMYTKFDYNLLHVLRHFCRRNQSFNTNAEGKEASSCNRLNLRQ